MIQRISIHALLAESDQTVTKWASSAKISIHALLAESDKSSWSLTRLNRNISIHALLAESDGLGFCYHCDDVAFLSTLSLRRATAPNRRPCRCNKISIHALLAESDLFFIVFDLFRNISIHALLAESDSPLSINCMIHMQFLSTLSLRRATMQIVIIVVDTVISIHALLAESDFMFSVVFYLENIFLSTLSLRRATTCGGGWNEQPRYFYPRSPCGERRELLQEHAANQVFLSTLSLRRATISNNVINRINKIFLSTLSLRRATAKVHKTVGHFCAYETNFMEIASSC